MGAAFIFNVFKWSTEARLGRVVFLLWVFWATHLSFSFLVGKELPDTQGGDFWASFFCYPILRLLIKRSQDCLYFLLPRPISSHTQIKTPDQQTLLFDWCRPGPKSGCWSYGLCQPDKFALPGNGGCQPETHEGKINVGLGHQAMIYIYIYIYI